MMTRKAMIITGSLLGAALLAVAIAVLVKVAQPKEADPYVQNDTPATTQTDTSRTDSSEKSPAQQDEEVPQVEAPKPTDGAEDLDPATVATIDIEALGVTVSYIKGAGAFEYQVSRTPSGTQYVEFTSGSLVGTKCTDDTGRFASLLVNPKSDEQSTLTKKVEVDGSTYGLSLASAACTADVDLLKTYQDSFSKALGLIKKQQ